MNLLNDVADAMRRMTAGSALSLPMSLDRVSGVSTATPDVGTAQGSVGGRGAGVGSDGSLSPDLSRPSSGQKPTSRPPVIRAGRSEARWENPIIDAAVPTLLRLGYPAQVGQPRDQVSRSQLALEVRLFRDRVSKSGFSPEVVTDASYLLCTYVDEFINDEARGTGSQPYNGEPSLLVEFHGDAWGGEDAFVGLQRWMVRSPIDLAILEFYEFILSFGWEGRYRVMERGHILLDDLRAQLHMLIWKERQPPALADPVEAIVAVERKQWLTATRALGIGVCAILLSYGAWILDLDLEGRPIREALAAWDPPIRTINLAETLPPPLPRLLSEGWVNARKVPQGWLLIFKSDKAFDVGQANFRPEFREQLDHLGAAFAPWPGDMEVVGHSDMQPIKTKQFPDNLALSEERARVVAQELLQTAVQAGARAPSSALPREIVWSGRGDSDPVDPAQTAVAYERNRRVEVLWKVANLEPQSPRAVER